MAKEEMVTQIVVALIENKYLKSPVAVNKPSPQHNDQLAVEVGKLTVDLMNEIDKYYASR